MAHATPMHPLVDLHVAKPVTLPQSDDILAEIGLFSPRREDDNLASNALFVPHSPRPVAHDVTSLDLAHLSDPSVLFDDPMTAFRARNGLPPVTDVQPHSLEIPMGFSDASSQWTEHPSHTNPELSFTKDTTHQFLASPRPLPNDVQHVIKHEAKPTISPNFMQTMATCEVPNLIKNELCTPMAATTPASSASSMSTPAMRRDQRKRARASASQRTKESQHTSVRTTEVSTVPSNGLPSSIVKSPKAQPVAKPTSKKAPLPASNLQGLTKRAQRVIRTREAATRNRMEQRAKMENLKSTNERLSAQTNDLLSKNQRLKLQVEQLLSIKESPLLLKRILTELARKSGKTA